MIQQFIESRKYGFDKIQTKRIAFDLKKQLKSEGYTVLCRKMEPQLFTEVFSNGMEGDSVWDSCVYLLQAWK